MKTIKPFAIAAAALMMSFASCNKDNTGNGKIDEGNPTYMGISFTISATGAATRADANATEAETAFKFVDVFIYNKATGTQATHARISANDFTGPTGGTGSDDWTLKAAAKIATTTGEKAVIVGVNLSSDLSASLVGASMGEFINIAQSVIVDDVTGATDGFAMFSTEVKNVTLIKDPDFNARENYPTVQVQRLVAKVTVQKDENINIIANGTLDNLMFELNNTNKKTFYIQPADKKDHNWETTPAGDLNALNNIYVAVNEYDATVRDLNAKYALENTTRDFLMGQVTRATIRGTFVPALVKEFFNDTDNSEGYKDVDVTSTVPATFYSVIYNMGANRAYFFDEAVANDFADDNNATAVTYTDGLCYWDMFLNPDNNPDGLPDMGGPFDVLRNDFYRCNIIKIVAPGRATPEVTDPNQPPTQETDLMVDIQMLYWKPIMKDYTLEP